MKKVELATTIKEAMIERKRTIVLYGITGERTVTKVIIGVHYSTLELSISGRIFNKYEEFFNFVEKYYRFAELFLTEEDANNCLEENAEKEINERIERFFS